MLRLNWAFLTNHLGVELQGCCPLLCLLSCGTRAKDVKQLYVTCELCDVSELQVHCRCVRKLHKAWKITPPPPAQAFLSVAEWPMSLEVAFSWEDALPSPRHFTAIVKWPYCQWDLIFSCLHTNWNHRRGASVMLSCAAKEICKEGWRERTIKCPSLQHLLQRML